MWGRQKRKIDVRLESMSISWNSMLVSLPTIFIHVGRDLEKLQKDPGEGAGLASANASHTIQQINNSVCVLPKNTCPSLLTCLLLPVYSPNSTYKKFPLSPWKLIKKRILGIHMALCSWPDFTVYKDIILLLTLFFLLLILYRLLPWFFFFLFVTF